MEASIGGSLNVTKTKSKASERSFSIDVEIKLPGDLQAYNEGLNRMYDPSTGRAVIVPGKVDAYRFMTFYLEPNTDNFDVFVNKVVDPQWLAEDKSANAAAVREAVNARNKVQKDTEKSLPWRVFHRVTFLSRILPDVDDSAASSTEALLRELEIDSNYELIKRLEPFVRDKTNDYAEFAEAVREAIGNYMPKLAPAQDEITHFLSLYFQVFPD